MFRKVKQALCEVQQMLRKATVAMHWNVGTVVAGQVVTDGRMWMEGDEGY